jgi:hypothetical protein
MEDNISEFDPKTLRAAHIFAYERIKREAEPDAILFEQLGRICFETLLRQEESNEHD